MRWLFSSLLLAFSLAFVLTVAPGATASTQLPALANLARDRPTFCSSIEATCTLCCYAVDGDPATRWSSQFSDPGWIYVDLGASARIERVILRWEAAYGQAYQVQTSHDAVNWSDIYSTTAGTEQLLRHIDWEDLTKPDGLISMGYTYDGARLAGTWNIFGGESWLIGLAYASATGTVAPTYPSPPTANGSGFIDELAWLFVPRPPGGITGERTGQPIAGRPRTDKSTTTRPTIPGHASRSLGFSAYRLPKCRILHWRRRTVSTRLLGWEAVICAPTMALHC